MKSIFAQMLYMMQKHQDTVLVTIIKDKGSTPRGAGSQMLVGTMGRLSGTIGGGAVEMRSMEIAQKILLTHENTLHSFVLRSNKQEDIGMICGGDVDVWFQYISAQDSLWRDIAANAMQCFEKHLSGWLVLPTDGSKADLVYNQDEIPEGVFAVELTKGERAIIFGAGHIARSLVPILRSVDFRPIVFDVRPEYAKKEFFPDAEAVICGDYSRVSDYLKLTVDDYVVIMTNGHSYDYMVEKQVLMGSFGYVGVIGSRKKTAAVNAKLWADGIPEEVTKQVHTPIGTAIKAVTPAEIAVSIAGEMICVRATLKEENETIRHGCPMH